MKESGFNLVSLRLFFFFFHVQLGSYVTQGSYFYLNPPNPDHLPLRSSRFRAGAALTKLNHGPRAFGFSP